MIELILLERVEKLGQMGQLVKVKPGFARNYLLPQKKALRATKENLAYFETQRAQLEANNLERKSEAAEVGAKLEGLTVVLVRQAGESGQLYGSVSARDIADAVTAAGFTIERGRSCSNGRSRISACTRCASYCIRRCRSRSPPMSRNRPRRRRCRRAASIRCAAPTKTRSTTSAPPRSPPHLPRRTRNNIEPLVCAPRRDRYYDRAYLCGLVAMLLARLFERIVTKGRLRVVDAERHPP